MELSRIVLLASGYTLVLHRLHIPQISSLHFKLVLLWTAATLHPSEWINTALRQAAGFTSLTALC